MYVYVWQENGIYYRALADLTGRIFDKSEITNDEHNAITQPGDTGGKGKK